MLSSLKYLLKKYWGFMVLAIIINVPILVFCCYRTNKALILKGDTVEFNAEVEVENSYETSGSFSTIYVLTMEHSTLFQNILGKYDPEIEMYTMSSGEASISYYDSYFASRIQYASSIAASIIYAYTEAKDINTAINIDYEYIGAVITYHGENSALEIGDRIVGIKKVSLDSDGNKLTDESGNYIYDSYIDLSDTTAYLSALSSTKSGDIWYLEDNSSIDSSYKLAGSKEIREVTLEAGESMGWYGFYDIDYDTLSPSVKFNSNNTGGPSGGLLQTLSIYNSLIEEDLTSGLKIAGTGTISVSGKVGAIGGIKEKIPTAIDDGIDVFFCPEANYDDAYEKYTSIKGHNKMALVKVTTFDDAIEYLRGLKE
ncbi:MAG: hypothetical protein K6A63_04135 [Acholeplasmatales bacterium]|nr:hypothetical protein [Acholeplasmatales bacterium]